MTFIRVLIFLGVVLATAWLWTRMERRKRAPIPPMPERFRLLSAVDERLQEGVNMRDRLAGLAGRSDNALQSELVFEVDQLLGSCADVVEVRIELQRMLQVVDRARIAQDAEALDEERAERQLGHVEHLEERPGQLDNEVAAAIGDLRELYLFVLDNLDSTSLADDSVVAKTRERAEKLALRVSAERELKDALSDDDVTFH